MLRNAYYQQITAQAQQRQADAAQTALFLQHQQREGATGLKFTHDLLECIAMAQGMQDGFAGLELEPSPEYMKTSRGCIQNFCTSIPIPFSAFDGIRRTKHTVELTRDQEESVMRSFDKLVGADEKNSPTKTKDISIPLPFVSVFFSQRCPELRGSFGKTTPSGATYLLLSVVTGHAGLCGRCLKAGANPNNLTFLQDSQKPSGEMFHGYSPMFMAVLAEQIGIMDLLHGCGGSVHVYDRWGRTPLHAAVAMNSVEVVQWLMAKGAPRYVGDCLNLIPAESSEEDYFPELAMPNLALYGQPKPPSMEQLSASIAVTCGETAPAWSGVDEGSALAAASGSNTTTAEASSKPAGSEEGRREVHCHCRSGLGIGFCGCVDDMYQRWTVDRLRTTWSPGVNYYNLMLQQGESAAGCAQ